MPPDSALAEAALAYVMENASVLALQLDTNQRVIVANAYARRILGTDVMGKTLKELIVDFVDPPDALEGSTFLLSLKTTNSMPESFSFRRFALIDGALLLGGLDFTEQTRLGTEVLGLNRELSNVTRQLHVTNAELRELNDLKNKFLGMAAHDLRSPICVIMSCSEFVLDTAHAQLTPELREILGMCFTSAIDMNRIVDDFLDLSVIESGKLRLAQERITAAKIVSGALPICKMVAENKKVRLLVDPADEARPLEADAHKLQQVLANLVRNAVEHSKPDQRVWLTSHWDDKHLVFAVRDEGPGIALEDQAQLFKAYARVNTQKTAGERSVGLGLSIARMVVEAHGGRIWVDSTLGQGANFQFSIPVR